MPDDDHARIKKRVVANPCPHCGSKSRVAASRMMSPLSRESYHQCLNVECGHTWRSIMSAVMTIVPSRTPNPEVHIPLSEKVRPMTDAALPEPAG